jgi:acetyltransferase-like isoleucine patch superfamily enzyme
MTQENMNSKIIVESINYGCGTQEIRILRWLLKIFHLLMKGKKQKFDRVLPFGDYFTDRWEKAKFLGFGEGSNVYDNVIILGNVKVGKNTWIGPNVILDGSGELEIGSNCSISAGVQIYSHDSIKWAISGGKESYEYAKTIIEDNCYIAPNVIIQKGITIGKGSIIGANSLVNKNIPINSKAYGTPVEINSLNRTTQ